MQSSRSLRFRSRASLVVLAGAISLGSASLAGCSKPVDSAAQLAAVGDARVTDRFDKALVAMSMAPDGKVTLGVQDEKGAPIVQDVKGTVSVKGPGAAAATTVPLDFDKKTATLTGAAAPLANGLSQVDYNLTAGGTPLVGTLFLPAGGTKELVASLPPSGASPSGDGGVTTTAAANAGAAASVNLPKGPHGGAVQVSGKDKLEIVEAGDGSGEVRVYVLGADGVTVVPTGKRKIELGLVVGDASETVILVADPSSTYFVGKVKAKGEPKRIVIHEVDEGGTTHVVVLGAVHENVFVVTHDAPKVHVVVQGPIVSTPVVVVKTEHHVVDHGIRIDLRGVEVDDDHDHDHGHHRGHHGHED